MFVSSTGTRAEFWLKTAHLMRVIGLAKKVPIDSAHI
jgi:hypothetical protein